MISKFAIGDLFSYKSIVRDSSYDGVYEVVDIQIHTSSPSIFRYTLKRIPDIGQSECTIARYEHTMADEKGFICINHNPRYSACHERRSSDPSMRGQHKVFDPNTKDISLTSFQDDIKSKRPYPSLEWKQTSTDSSAIVTTDDVGPKYAVGDYVYFGNDIFKVTEILPWLGFNSTSTYGFSKFRYTVENAFIPKSYRVSERRLDTENVGNVTLKRRRHEVLTSPKALWEPGDHICCKLGTHLIIRDRNIVSYPGEVSISYSVVDINPRHPGSKQLSQKELIESGAIKIKEKSESVKRYLNSFYGLNAFKDVPINFSAKPYEPAVNYAEHDAKYVAEYMANFYSIYKHKTEFRCIILNSEVKEMNKPIYKEDIDKQFKAAVKKVIFNGDATIVIWDDGSKTVVKRRKGERKDKEKAIMYCILEKQLGETFAKKMIDRFIEEGEKND